MSDTKAKGDIAEQSVLLKALKFGWNVLKPVGDRLPYDMVFEINNRFCRIQVKSAWFRELTNRWYVETRRTKTNRREMKREYYSSCDFDFVIIHANELDVFWIMPINEFLSYKGEITLGITDKQRILKSNDFKNAWHLISQWASQEGIPERQSVKFGETVSVAIPSQAELKNSEGVET